MLKKINTRRYWRYNSRRIPIGHFWFSSSSVTSFEKDALKVVADPLSIDGFSQAYSNLHNAIRERNEDLFRKSILDMNTSTIGIPHGKIETKLTIKDVNHLFYFSPNDICQLFTLSHCLYLPNEELSKILSKNLDVFTSENLLLCFRHYLSLDWSSLHPRVRMLVLVAGEMYLSKRDVSFQQKNDFLSHLAEKNISQYHFPPKLESAIILSIMNADFDRDFIQSDNLVKSLRLQYQFSSKFASFNEKKPIIRSKFRGFIDQFGSCTFSNDQKRKEAMECMYLGQRLYGFKTTDSSKVTSTLENIIDKYRDPNCTNMIEMVFLASRFSRLHQFSLELTDQFLEGLDKHWNRVWGYNEASLCLVGLSKLCSFSRLKSIMNTNATLYHKLLNRFVNCKNRYFLAVHSFNKFPQSHFSPPFTLTDLDPITFPSREGSAHYLGHVVHSLADMDIFSNDDVANFEMDLERCLLTSDKSIMLMILRNVSVLRLKSSGFRPTSLHLKSVVIDALSSHFHLPSQMSIYSSATSAGDRDSGTPNASSNALDVMSIFTTPSLSLGNVMLSNGEEVSPEAARLKKSETSSSMDGNQPMNRSEGDWFSQKLGHPHNKLWFLEEDGRYSLSELLSIFEAIGSFGYRFHSLPRSFQNGFTSELTRVFESYDRNRDKEVVNRLLNSMMKMHHFFWRDVPTPVQAIIIKELEYSLLEMDTGHFLDFLAMTAKIRMDFNAFSPKLQLLMCDRLHHYLSTSNSVALKYNLITDLLKTDAFFCSPSHPLFTLLQHGVWDELQRAESTLLMGANSDLLTESLEDEERRNIDMEVMNLVDMDHKNDDNEDENEERVDEADIQSLRSLHEQVILQEEMENRFRDSLSSSLIHDVSSSSINSSGNSNSTSTNTNTSTSSSNSNNITKKPMPPRYRMIDFRFALNYGQVVQRIDPSFDSENFFRRVSQGVLTSSRRLLECKDSNLYHELHDLSSILKIFPAEYFGYFKADGGVDTLFDIVKHLLRNPENGKFHTKGCCEIIYFLSSVCPENKEAYIKGYLRLLLKGNPPFFAKCRKFINPFMKVFLESVSLSKDQQKVIQLLSL